MRVLDLFCGLGGWGSAFIERGHEVVSVDIDPAFNPTLAIDVMGLSPDRVMGFDMILASPPCEAFSVASIGHHWGGGHRAYQPKTEHAHKSIRLVEHTLAIIAHARPKFWVVENPRGVLRKLGILDDFERVTVTFCAYGDTRMKPTDLWGGFPDSWRPKPMCSNGDPCHDAAPRGARTGTQGLKGAADRAVIPTALSLSICLAAEKDLAIEKPRHPEGLKRVAEGGLR